MPDPIERDTTNDPTWTQRYLGAKVGRRRDVTLRVRLLTPSEIPEYKIVFDADKVRARLARTVGR